MFTKAQLRNILRMVQIHDSHCHTTWRIYNREETLKKAKQMAESLGLEVVSNHCFCIDGTYYL